MARSKGPGPSQADLAAALDVSISTVSRALSNAPGISDSVRQRVAQAAIELGYRHRAAADPSRLSSVTVLATLFGATGTLAYVYQEMLAGLLEQAGEMHLPVETLMTAETDRLPAGYAERLEPGRGLVFLGLVPDNPSIDLLDAADVASVIVNGVDPGLRLDSVSPANYFGGRLIAAHLAELGHRHVAFAAGSRRWTLTRRFHGFRDGMADHHGSEAHSVKTVSIATDSPSEQLATLRDWLSKEADGITALFCFNDTIALAAIEALGSLGYSVPGDVSVVGFDDMPTATMCSPQLTTFRVDWRAIGREALQYLDRRRSDPLGSARDMQIGGSLVVRQSSGPVPGRL